MTKAPTPIEKSKNQRDNTKTPPNNNHELTLPAVQMVCEANRLSNVNEPIHVGEKGGGGADLCHYFLHLWVFEL